MDKLDRQIRLAYYVAKINALNFQQQLSVFWDFEGFFFFPIIFFSFSPIFYGNVSYFYNQKR